MPGLVPPIDDERELLLAYLGQQRYVLRLAAHGLSDEQARAKPAASELSIGGLVKHATSVEKGWVEIALERHLPASSDDYEENFRLGEEETIARVLARSEEVGHETEIAIRGIDDLGRPVPVPRDVPWFPADVDAWSVRWVLLHLIEETARHAGHADIVRESLDGATAFPLMAAAESWPPSPWMRPWSPRVTTS